MEILDNSGSNILTTHYDAPVIDLTTSVVSERLALMDYDVITKMAHALKNISLDDQKSFLIDRIHAASNEDDYLGVLREEVIWHETIHNIQFVVPS